MGDVFPVAASVVAAGAGVVTGNYFAQVSVSENGLLLYTAGGAAASNQIVWFDRAGKLLGPVGSPGGVWERAISPDEKTIAFSRTTGTNSETADIWLRDLAR
jgi:hypothetical protein